MLRCLLKTANCGRFKRTLFTSNSPSNTHYEYLIVGGGPMGSSIALHLAEKGAQNILVLEKDFGYKNSSAMLSCGGVRQQFSVPENINMSIYGADFIKSIDRLAVDGDVPDLQFHEIGYLFLAGKNSRSILEANVRTQHECGAEWIQLMEAAQLRVKFPWLAVDNVDAGSFGTKNEGYFDPWAFVGAMKRKACSLGVTYLEGKVVGGHVQPVAAGSSEYTVSSVDVVGTKSQKEYNFSVGTVVNAAGAWSGQFVDSIKAKMAQSKGIKQLPVYPRKRNVFAFHCPGNTATADFPVPPRATPLTIDPSGVYFRPEGSKAGGFIAGVSPLESEDRDVSAAEEAAGAIEQVDHAQFEEAVWPKLCEMAPAFEELRVTAAWAGFYDYNTLDQNAIIGYHSELRNMVLCTGFSGHGLQQAPAAGRAVSELLTGSRRFETLDLSRFGFERVVNNTPIFETGIV